MIIRSQEITALNYSDRLNPSFGYLNSVSQPPVKIFGKMFDNLKEPVSLRPGLVRSKITMELYLLMTSQKLIP